MEAIMNILNNSASKTMEQRGPNPKDDLSLYVRVDGIFDYVGQGRLLKSISENKDTSSIRQTLHANPMHTMTIRIWW